MKKLNACQILEILQKFKTISVRFATDRNFLYIKKLRNRLAHD